MLKLTFLGTSSGMPTKDRNVSGLAVECLNPHLKGDKTVNKRQRPWVLIDCGEGTQQQLLHTKHSLHQLSAICITHVHGDHCYGLPGLLSSMAMSGRNRPLTLIAPKAISKLLDTLTITTELYFPYEIEFIAIESLLNNTESQKDNQAENHIQTMTPTVHLSFSSTHQLNIEITALSHRVPSYAFALTQTIHQQVLDKDKLMADGIEPSQIWGKLQAGENATLDNGQVIKANNYLHSNTSMTKIVVAGDNDTPELLADAVKGARLLVHESTYTQTILDKIHARKQTDASAIDPQHSTAKQVAEFAQKNDVEYLILSHFSARYQLFDDVKAKVSNMGHIRAEVEQYYDGQYQRNFWLAADFDCYLVNETVIRLISTQ